MRAVVQRVLNAGVTVDGEYVGKIGRGYLVLLGLGHGDTRAEADKLWGKLRGLRINEDENGKTNLALADVDGEVLVVSQFTLFAMAQAIKMKKFNQDGKLTDEVIQSIMEEEKPNQKEKPAFRDERITKLIPKTVPKGQEADFVVKALEFYNRHLQRNKAHER